MRTFALVGVLAVALAACGGSDSSTADEPSTTAEVVDEPDEVAPPPDTDADVGADADADTDADDEAMAGGEAEPGDDVQRWPDVIDATGRFDGTTWTISATLSSPYDTPERYADSWRVIGPDGAVYGERFLLHDHENEQPFTRSQSGIEIPDDVQVVTIEGRDQVYGWGGGTFELELER